MSTGEDAAARVRAAVWSAASVATPAVLVRCLDVSDVRRAIIVAGDHGLPVSVLSGGHDWAGRSVHPGGITLDLRDLNEVALDATGTGVTVGGGTTTRGLLSALPDDRAVVTGVWSSTGIVGVALGGGYGKLNRKFGLASDNVERAEVVLADGSLALAGEHDDSELLWALRGGGGNFGVVTSMTFKVHAVSRVLSGLFFVPLERAKPAMTAVQDMLDEDDDGLSIQPILATMPSLGCGLLLTPLWVGDEAEGERRFGAIARLSGARCLAQGWSSYGRTVDEANEAAWPKRGDYRMGAHNVPRLSEAVIDILIGAARRFTSDIDALVMHDFFGAATRVAEGATAFRMREAHVNLQVVAGRNAARDADGLHRSAWLRDVAEAFAPWRARGAYPNILGPDERERARAFYGSAVPRLERAKAAYDPHDRFPSNVGAI